MVCPDVLPPGEQVKVDTKEKAAQTGAINNQPVRFAVLVHQDGLPKSTFNFHGLLKTGHASVLRQRGAAASL